MIRVSIWMTSLIITMAISGCGSKGGAQATPSLTSETQIVGTCLVHSYKGNAASYVTHQKHIFSPETSNLKIISEEPQGRRVWNLNKNDFQISTNAKEVETDLYDKNMMQAIFFSMVSSAELLSGEQLTSGEPVKVEGQWDIPYQVDNKKTQVELFQDNASKRYDLAFIGEDKIFLQARNYNYWYEKNLKRQIPRTIDIFDISNGMASKTLIMRVEYLSIEAIVRK